VVLTVVLACGAAAVTAGAAEDKDKAKAAQDWKPRIHFYAGPSWNNDPNGPILLDGQYHLFFQNNPYGDLWDHMSWGHAVSGDLVHWTRLPIALPEESGVMNFNGTVVEDPNNTSGFCSDAGKSATRCLVVVYTGDSRPKPAEERQNQNLAYSRDGGITWTKYAQNPVLDLALADFRDPKVFWHEPSKSWVMLVMLAKLHSVQIYRSNDLKHWKLASSFGPKGATSGVWECPDLMNLDVRDGKGNKVGSRWVLSVNLNPGGVAGGSGNQYFVGQFDGSRFVEDHPGSGIHWVDWGKDFYASTSFANIPANENRLWIAWMDNWDYAHLTPSLPGRGEMTVARRIYLRQENAEGSAEPLVLVQEPDLPIPAHSRNKGPLTVEEANARLAEGGAESGVYLLRAKLEPGSAEEAGVRLRRSSLKADEAANEETVVGIDRAKGQIYVDRKRSGYVSFSPDFPARTVAPLKHPEAKAIPIEIIVDRNSVEVFAEDGETVLTNLIFPSDASQGLAFYATGVPAGGEAAHVSDLELVPLQ
jgi:sucrose-6-phosphate hydrolase SacC (GH32 family)